jgi:predicted metal-dependent peptidase
MPEQFTPNLSDAIKEAETAPWAAKSKELTRSLDDARTYLYMRHSFFGRLVMKMKCVFTESVDTAAVRADAVTYLNPNFWLNLDAAERSFLLAHELCHLAYMHFHRIGKKNPILWNEAGDYMINSMLMEAGMKMPTRPDLKGLYDVKYKEMADEQIYAILWKEHKENLKKAMEQLQQQGGGGCPDCGQQLPQPGQGPQGQNGQPQPGPGNQPGQGQPQSQGGNPPGPNDCGTCGQRIDPKQQQQGQGSGSQQPGKGFGKSTGDCDFGATPKLEKDQGKEGSGQKVLSPAQWKAILVQAAQATTSSQRGDIPGNMKRWIDALKDPQIDWLSYLRRLTSQAIRRGSSYRRPSRRSGALAMADGIPEGVMPIMPGQKTAYPPVVIAIDSSGSRGNKEIMNDLAETFGVLKLYPGVPIRAIVCDAEIQSDQVVRKVTEINIKGGGGTRSEPVFELLERDKGAKKPQCLIYFTDMFITFPERKPNYPVFWVHMGNGESPVQPPFGIVINRPIDLENYGLDASTVNYVAERQKQHNQMRQLQAVERAAEGEAAVEAPADPIVATTRRM